jgi:mono/diheme cytochrome c family protein
MMDFDARRQNERDQRMTRGIVVGLVAFGVMAIGVVGHAGQAKPAVPAKAAAAAKASKNPVAADAASVAAGRAGFVKYCRACHGVEGKGDGPGRVMLKGSVKPADLTDEKWDHGSTDGEIFATIHDGIGPTFDMDTWEDRIEDKDIWNLVNYIRTLKK